jgi:hypothetical protein
LERRGGKGEESEKLPGRIRRKPRKIHNKQIGPKGFFILTERKEPVPLHVQN